MATIRALAVEGPDQPPAVTDVPAPSPAPGEVLVRVRAASINYYDVFVASGAAGQYMSYEHPVVVGQDVAGVVESVGEGVEGFAAGDRVFGMLGHKGVIHDGTFGELAVPLASGLAPTPEGLDDQAAGSLGVAGTTAVEAVDVIGAGEGSTVLVVGATGGVGSFVLQIAALRGAVPIATVRPGDEEFVRSLGAAETVDYTGDLAAQVRERWPDGVDALVDLVNRDPAAFASLTELVRPGGKAVSVVGGAGEATRIGEVDVAGANGKDAHLAPLAGLVVEGKVRVAISGTYPLDRAADALRDFTERHTLGKIVITVG
jgi:NADPH:quinone reductase-like Zn-dependent oxidoreductase